MAVGDPQKPRRLCERIEPHRDSQRQQRGRRRQMTRHMTFPSAWVHPLRISNIPLMLLLLSISIPRYHHHALAYLSNQTPLRLDCGSDAPSSTTTASGLSLAFEADKGYENTGKSATIPNAEKYGLSPAEATLRYFPGNSPSCYTVHVAPGRYLVRLGWAYYNYDGRNAPPCFGVLLQGTLSEAVDMKVVQSQFVSGAYYSDYIVFALGGVVSVCLQPSANEDGRVSNPFLNTLEVLPVDTTAYDATQTGNNVILSTYLRLNMGGGEVGPEPQDPGFRTWAADVNETAGHYRKITTGASIKETGTSPAYLPQAIFQSCREAAAPKGATGFRLAITPVGPANNWYLRYYFAEPNPAVLSGQRLFSILLGSGSSFDAVSDSPKGFDIQAKAGAPLSAVVVPVFFNFSEHASGHAQDLEVGVKTAEGSQFQAVICGVELFQVIPVQETPEGKTTPSASASPGPSPSGVGSLSGGSIAGIVLGTVLAVLLVTAFVVYLVRRRSGGSFVPLSSTSSEPTSF